MKITESQLTDMVKEQLIKTLNEAKYKKMYSIVKEAFNSDPRFSYNEFGEEGIDNETGEESFPVKIGSQDAPLQHLHVGKWGDYNPDMDNIFCGKKEDNEDSWEELDSINQDTMKNLGGNAQDVFDGNYGLDNGDYFQDSDNAFTQNYWNDEEGPQGWSLSDIQRQKINDVYDDMEESKLREMIKSKLRETINEKRYNKMYDIVRKNIVECLKSENGKKFITEAMKKSATNENKQTVKNDKEIQLESIIKKHVKNSLMEALKR